MPTDPRRALQATLILWTLAALAVLVPSLGAVGKAFPGFELGPTGMLGVTDMADWAGRQAGLVPLDRIVAVDGRPLGSPDAFYARVREEAPGTVHRYRLDTGREVAVPARAFTGWDWLRAAGLFWLAAVVHLLVGGWVVWRRPTLPAAVAHWRYCQAFAVFLVTGTLAPFYPTWELGGDLGGFAVGVFVLELALLFPRPLAVPAPWLTAQRVLALVLTGFVLYSCVDQAWYRTAMQAVLVVPSLQVVAAIGLWLWQAVSRREPPLGRAQARVIVAGMGLAMLPSLALALAGALKVSLPGSELAFLGFLAFPAAIAYAIVRHRVFELERLVRGATLYAGLTALLALLYWGAAALGHLVVGDNAGLVAALAVAVGLRPLHDGLRRGVDRLFLGSRPDPLATLAELEADVTELADLAARTAALVRTALGAAWVETSLGEAVGHAGTRPAGAEAEVVLPIRPAEGAAGSLAVGPRASELPYTGGERALLGVLALNVARGVERLALAEARHALELREATARARAEARDAMLKQVVHDLATDLSNIAVAADLARQAPDDDQAWGSLDASLDRIDRFLAEKRAQLQDQAPRRASRLAVGMEATRTVLAAVVEAKGQQCRFEVADPAAEVPLSEIELVQVLVNVVGNAVKFTPAGGAISCVAGAAGDRLHVVVADSGPGIPTALLGRLGDGGRADPALPGSGLGLQNARRLVEDAGGTLAWRNGGPGAVVEIAFPLNPAPLAAQ